MWTHLSCKHPSLNLSKPGQSHTSAAALTRRQTTLTSFAKSCTPMPTADQEAITKKIALMCALDLKPLSLVQGTGFKMYSEALNPNLKVPTREAVTKYLLAIYDDKKQKLVKRISGVPLAATTDLWTSNAMQGYITLTGHYLTNDWVLNSNILGTTQVSERHTGTNIAIEVNTIIQEFQVPSLSAITTDNAGNMNAAAR